MKKQFFAYGLMLVLLGMTSCAGTRVKDAPEMLPLKEAFAGKFLIGAAVNVNQMNGQDTAAVRVLKQHFNSIVAENCMKSALIHPEEDRYAFDDPDRFVAFGEANGMAIIGHTLIWHSQCAPWFCVDDQGNPVSAEVLKQRMRDHIHTIVGRYKGRIKGWDVVNEAIVEDGSYRDSPFYRILGEEFIPLAFQYAHEADPDAELYLNDYGMNGEGRRNTYVRLINELKQRGLRIDGIGMQGHMGMDYPDFAQFEASIRAFAATGVKVMITEWDMSALPTLHQSANVSDTVSSASSSDLYADGLPAAVDSTWNHRMHTAMELFLKYADVIDRVTAWGVSDGDSWKNDWPVKGRTEYPLLFDRQHNPKPFLLDYMRPAATGEQ